MFKLKLLNNCLKVVTTKGMHVSSALGNFSLNIDMSHLLAKYPGGRVTVERNETSGIAVITLHHAERKNALSGHMMLQLASAVTELGEWNAGRAVILRGDGGTFCSGGDLTLMKAIANPEDGRVMSKLMQNTMARLAGLPLVSVAVVQGHALGGGAELCVACDFRLLSQSSSMGFVQSKMGVSTGWGGGVALTRLLGRRRALDLLLSGRVVKAMECIQLGLADGLLPDDDALEQAKAWLLKKMPSSIPVCRAAKQVVSNACQTHDNYEEILRRENDIFATVWGGKDQLAILKAALKKHA